MGNARPLRPHAVSADVEAERGLAALFAKDPDNDDALLDLIFSYRDRVIRAHLFGALARLCYGHALKLAAQEQARAGEGAQ